MKISEAFEGENSSLRKAFDEATKDTTTEHEWRKRLKNQSWYQESDDITKIAIQVFVQSELQKSVPSLRQWLNEERITDPQKMVTNEDLMYWLNLK